MSDHDRRSLVASPPIAPAPQRWQRPDAPRPGPQLAPEMNLPGDMLLDPPDALHGADLFGLLPQAARRDLVAGLGEVRL